jgi:Serine hydrolase (FSH1)
MKVLCLHGSRQTSEIFKHRLRKVEARVAPLGITLYYLDAPHTLPLQPGDDVPTRQWWLRDGSGRHAGQCGRMTQHSCSCKHQ